MDASINIDRNVMMETRDGTRLAAEVYRPDGAAPCPAIVMRTPYASEGILSGLTWLKILPTVRAGYALVIAYQRGRFGSEGVYDLRSPQEIEGPDRRGASPCCRAGSRNRTRCWCRR